MNVGLWLFAVLIIELIAILCVAYLSFIGFFDPMRTLTKVAVWMMTFGLMVQIMRTLHYFQVGAYPVDTYFPLWVTKDIGASLLVLDLVILHLKSKPAPDS